MPNIINFITFLRIALIPFLLLFYYLQPSYLDANTFNWANLLMVGVYIIAGITDYLDGYLARKFNMTSELGALLDPVADKLIVATALILLVDFYPNYNYWYITVCSVIIISREILVSALREWMSSIGKRSKVKVNFIGKIKAFVQILAIIFLLYKQPFLSDFIFKTGVLLLIVATSLTFFSGVIYLIEGIKNLTINEKIL
jgi:CDP-diacylglycerol--glycerol-3-phosphate 3-phosphatidyltransferase